MSGAASEHLKEHVIVRAGAGAGKTRRLTLQVIETARSFYARENRFPRMIVTTFTRKATQELRERLMLWALTEAPDMVDFVNSRSHLVVSTIHGVLDIYLKRYGGNICIDPGYAIMGTAEAERISRQVVRSLLTENAAWQPLLETYGFNRLVSLLRRFHEMILRVPEARPHDRSSFEAVFGEFAQGLASEIRELAAHVEAESTKEDWLTMASDLREVAVALTKGNWAERRDAVLTRISAIKTARYSAKNPPVSEETNALAKQLLPRVRDLDDEIYDPAAWDEFASTFKVFDGLGREFSKRVSDAKTRHGSIEISDLELLAMRCIRQHPETVEAFAEEWDYWLIDEYQDTSPFQVELLRHLSGARPNFIVGDPQQSIYLFRGARSEVFGEKEQEILAGGGHQDLLVKNYRSRPELLVFFNDLFGRLTFPFRPMEPNLQEGQKLDADRVVARFVTLPEQLDDGEATGVEDGKDGESVEPKAESKAARDARKVDQHLAETYRGHAGATSARDVSQMEDRDPEMLSLVRYVQDLITGGAAPEDICVLARTNQTLVDVAGWLGRYQLPTHVHAASGFYSRRETMDALALLKFLVNPHDSVNATQLLRSPWFRVPDDVLVRRLGQAGTGSHWERVSSPVGNASGVAESAALQDVTMEAVHRLRGWLERRNEVGISETFRQALVESGFIDFSHLHDMSGRRESNVWKLLTKLSQEEGQPGFNYLDFISSSAVDLRESTGAEESDAIAAVEPDRINLMTIHSSKGLQFKHVIVPRAGQAPRLTRSEDFTFDEQRRRWAMRVPRGEMLEMAASLAEKSWLETFRRQELEEHARVFYVALTRAVESVFLSWTGTPAKDSWADMLRWDLSEGEHRTEAYTYFVDRGTAAPVGGTVRAQETVEPRRAWGAPLQAVIPAPTHQDVSVSVSELLDRSGPARKSWEALNIPNRLRLASQGTAVHRLMEALKSPAGDSIRNLIQRWFPEKEDKVLASVRFVSESQEPPLADLIRHGCVEWGFAFLENGTLVEGQIDLWGRVETETEATVWVVDYKTGNPEGREKAFHQLALYAFALRKAGEVRPGDRVRLAAVYPFVEKVFIEEEPPRAFYAERFSL